MLPLPCLVSMMRGSSAGATLILPQRLSVTGAPRGACDRPRGVVRPCSHKRSGWFRNTETVFSEMYGEEQVRSYKQKAFSKILVPKTWSGNGANYIIRNVVTYTDHLILGGGGAVKSRRLRWAGNVTRAEETQSLEERCYLARPKKRRVDTRAICKVRGLTLLLRFGTLWRCSDGLFFE